MRREKGKKIEISIKRHVLSEALGIGNDNGNDNGTGRQAQW